MLRLQSVARTLFVLLLAFPCAGRTEEPISRIDEDNYIAERIKPANTACGKDFTYRIEWAGFLEAAKTDVYHVGDVRHRPSAYCPHAFEALAYLCNTYPIYKEAIRKKVNTLQCIKGPKGSITLKDGVLTDIVDWDTFKDENAIMDYLKGVL